MRHFTDEQLMAFADGEASTDHELAAAVQSDPILAARVEHFAATRRLLKAQLAPVLDAPVPPQLLALLRKPATASVLPLRVRPAVRHAARRRAVWSFALAASLLLGVGLWSGQLWREPDALGSALEQLASGDARTVDGVEIMALSTLVDEAGRYCREYERSTTAGSTRGLACRSDAGRWSEQALPAIAQHSEGGDSGYRQAAGAMPDAALALRARRLTPDEEAQRIAAGWR